jgi:hypothetical protein
LYKALRKVDSEIQGEIVLLIGLVNDPEQIKMLHAVLPQAELNDDLKENFLLALARLGDKDAITKIILRLNSPFTEEQIEALKSLEYVNNPNLLIHVKHLLDDTSIALNIGIDADPSYLRICDLAVLTTNSISGRPLSFVKERRKFTEEERQQVAKYIEQNYQN